MAEPWALLVIGFGVLFMHQDIRVRAEDFGQLVPNSASPEHQLMTDSVMYATYSRCSTNTFSVGAC